MDTNLTQAPQALPVDIAFNVDASHIGLMVGLDSNGNLLLCHCSGSRNNVIVTELSTCGFVVVGRVDIW